MAEIAITSGSPAAGRRLNEINWPPRCVPVSVLRGRKLRMPEPAFRLGVGDRVNLLVAVARKPEEESPDRPNESREGNRPPDPESAEDLLGSISHGRLHSRLCPPRNPLWDGETQDRRPIPTLRHGGRLLIRTPLLHHRRTWVPW